MKTAVYLVHLLLVFGVPFAFGWVLVRRVFLEANWLTLLPAAVITGTVALMAIVNELRFTMEMHPALWFAYKLLLVLTLIMLVALRRTPRARLPGSAHRPWQLALLALGTVAVAAYYGIPAFNDYLNDSWWYHYPAAVQIQTTEFFPIRNVFAVDETLYYHYGPDILAASWSSLLDCPVQTGFALNIVIFAPCAFLLSFALLSRLTRNFWSPLLGASFLVAGGNLRFLLLLITKPAGAIGALQALNSQSVQGLQQLMFTPSHALGIPLVLTLLLLFRHIISRPSWLGAGVFGLLLGALTMVAEWYFIPLLMGIGLVLMAGAFGWIRSRRKLTIAFVAPAVAILWGLFNHTYLAGMFEHFWMPFAGIQQAGPVRQIEASFKPALTPVVKPSAAPTPASGMSTTVSMVSIPDTDAFGYPDNKTYQSVPLLKPTWNTPNLLPLRLNLGHFGQVASWEAAASAESTFIPILGTKFLMEITPVMLFGIPFGIWLGWKRRRSVVILLAFLAVSSTIPPLLLDWGYRSTDFLRFFTASYCFSALFFGWLVGEFLTEPLFKRRLLGGVLAASCLVNPIALGIIGLLPGTLATVKNVANTAQSLSQAAAPTPPDAVPPGVFEKLATLTGDYLFPLSQGRDRAIVIVPIDQIPEVKYFPEWMKMATISRLLLPVGWHWQNSLYSAYYREAVTTLDPRAIAALDAKWIIVSNVFQSEISVQAAEALADRSRFTPVTTLRDGPYYMSVFRALP